MNDLIQGYILEIGTALGGLLITYIILYINKAKAKLVMEASKIEDEKQRNLVNSAINRVNDLTINSVSMANQTIVAALKESISNGKIDKGELSLLGEKVANDIFTQLTPKMKETLETEIFDIKAYILSVVETQVSNLKPTVITTINPIATDSTTTIIESKDPVVVNVTSPISTDIPQLPSESVEPSVTNQVTNTPIEFGVL